MESGTYTSTIYSKELGTSKNAFACLAAGCGQFRQKSRRREETETYLTAGVAGSLVLLTNRIGFLVLLPKGPVYLRSASFSSPDNIETGAYQNIYLQQQSTILRIQV